MCCPVYYGQRKVIEMPVLTNRIRGTQDVLPKDSYIWQGIEGIMLEVAKTYGFSEIRTPVFEHTELFERSVGDTTDVVQKEMYTFDDKGGRSITLRPEGTAGTVRAVIENGLLNEALPLKACYISSCYRYEKPQAGRLREFHQFGVELFGSTSYTSDVQVIRVGQSVIEMLGLRNISLEINSIGCPDCRPEYHKALKDYFDNQKDGLCDTCKGRLTRNPMRILDCKCPACREIAKDAPVVLDFLCDCCAEHFDGVKSLLDITGTAYTVNPRIVRGLDYYTKTVFEFISNDIGSQGAVCAGGRYDGLCAELGGSATPGLGFGMGIERIILVMKNQGIELNPPEGCNVYFASLDSASLSEAFRLSELLREEGICAECDVMGRGLKAQMKYADKIGAKFTVVLGENELTAQKAMLKNMETGGQTEIALDDNFTDTLSKLLIDEKLSHMPGFESEDGKE